MLRKYFVDFVFIQVLFIQYHCFRHIFFYKIKYDYKIVVNNIICDFKLTQQSSVSIKYAYSIMKANFPSGIFTSLFKQKQTKLSSTNNRRKKLDLKSKEYIFAVSFMYKVLHVLKTFKSYFETC